MNYLAHLFLSGPDSEVRVGNLMADFRKGPLTLEYPDGIQFGLRLHQKIDAYTDAHPVVSLSKQLISPLNSRFARILVDVFYDHFLAKQWTHYSDAFLPVFAQQVYQALLDYETFLPEKLHQILPDFIQQDWLTSYQSLEGVKDALDRISKRLSRENCLIDATNDLQRHYASLQSHFNEFFPDMVQYIEVLPNSGSKLSP